MLSVLSACVVLGFLCIVMPLERSVCGVLLTVCLAFTLYEIFASKDICTSLNHFVMLSE